jgi:hypothetical protein
MVHHKVINDNYCNNLQLDRDCKNKDLNNLRENKDRIVAVVIVVVVE